ncbi:uncharacterized protein LOC142355384 [Convolutriloba macropyga]|uniref:uncharacterized protein LOC142355384 n=1 Tax=Convolutriloba macropyga TaxID=536237 RepID=UPI003F520D42
MMGWTSTADTHENLARAANGLAFATTDEAIAYCKKMGYEYTVKAPNPRSTTRTARFATYGDNYSTKRGGIPQGGLRSEL